MNAENTNKNAENAPATRASSELAPRRVTGDKPQGLDGIDINTDLKMPRMSILQPTSGIVTEGKGRMGELAHSITKENFGKEIEFIPLFVFKSRAKFEQGKGLVLMSRDNITVDFGGEGYEEFVGKPVTEVPHSKDPNTPATEWVGKEPPEFSLVYNFLCILTGPRINEFPIVLSLMRTGVPAAKDFLSVIAYSGEDAFSRVYKITTKIEDGDKGKFAKPIIDFVRRCTDEEYASAGKRFQDYYKRKKDISVDLESAHEETTS